MKKNIKADFSKLKKFTLLLLLPTIISLKLGGLRLTPLRVMLIFNFLSSYSNVFSGRCNGKDKVDITMILFALWCLISFAVNHGMQMALESGGVLVLETVGPYLLARSLLASKESFEFLTSFLQKVIFGLFFLLAFESITSINVIKVFINPLFGSTYTDGIDKRFGFTRSRGGFDHPIISGVFCSSMIGLAWFSAEKKIRNTTVMVLATVTSFSSGAIASIMTQLLVIGWEKYVRNVNNRWRLLIILILISYGIIELISNRSGIKVIISYLTFSPATAYWRTLIWEFGINNAINNPFFGIGFNDWARPSWMHSGSMDNFFLVIMVRHGFIAFSFFAYSIYSIASRLLKLNTSDPRLKAIRRGWLAGLVGLCISACTVHFWNQAYIYLMFYLGAGCALMKFIENKHAV